MAEPAEGPETAEKKKKFIMVVDGNPKDALTTGLILQNFGYSVTTVRSAEEALEFLSIAVPSLVIAEFILPGMNGIDLLGRMRQDPVVSKIPVVVQTSHPDPSSRVRCLEAGCILFLKKPVTGEDLYRTVQSIVERTPHKTGRVAMFLQASVDGTGTGAEFVTAISAQGMFVKTLHPRPVGSKHSVSFMLKKKIVRVDAVVLYAYGFGEGPAREPGMGMKFVAIDPEDSALIQTCIQESFFAGTPSK
jgi:CheY-like chemotaxis protein